jgi:hypothetical protein
VSGETDRVWFTSVTLNAMSQDTGQFTLTARLLDRSGAFPAQIDEAIWLLPPLTDPSEGVRVVSDSRDEMAPRGAEALTFAAASMESTHLSALTAPEGTEIVFAQTQSHTATSNLQTRDNPVANILVWYSTLQSTGFATSGQFNSESCGACSLSRGPRN